MIKIGSYCFVSFADIGVYRQMTTLMVTGSIGLDTVETPADRADNCLGGSAVYFAISAGIVLNKPIRLVGAVGDDFPEDYLTLLKKKNIDITGLEIRRGSKTFRWHGKYHANMNSRETVNVELNVLGEQSPVIPIEFYDSEYIFLANNDPILQLEFINQLRNPKFIVCDTMDLWIETQPENLRRVLERVNGIILNDAEATHLTGESNLISAAKAVCNMGPEFVIIKKGEHGALLLNNNRLIIVPAYPTEKVIDPTGAGDSFAGGFMGFVAAEDKTDFATQAVALTYGTVAASFTIESFSVDALVAADKDSLESRRGKLLEVMGKGILI